MARLVAFVLASGSVDWPTIASLATAGGTLVLAIATFSAVRSANRSARVAERSLAAGLRPLLMPSRLDDPTQKIMFGDEHWVKLPGGQASAEVGDGAVYFTVSLRNVGSGIAVLHAWQLGERRTGDMERPAIEGFRRHTRDLYISPEDVGFWQGAFRDPSAPEFPAVRKLVENRAPMMLDLLYGDFEGGQRTVSRFVLMPTESGNWLASVVRHWSIDRDDPR